jgi:hypothetical protein
MVGVQVPKSAAPAPAAAVAFAARGRTDAEAVKERRMERRRVLVCILMVLREVAFWYESDYECKNRLAVVCVEVCIENGISSQNL